MNLQKINRAQLSIRLPHTMVVHLRVIAKEYKCQLTQVVEYAIQNTYFRRTKQNVKARAMGSSNNKNK